MTVSGIVTRAGGCRGVRRGAEEAVLALAFGGACCGGFGVVRTDMAKLARHGWLEVTWFTH